MTKIEIEKLLMKCVDSIFGNGKAGLKERIARLEVITILTGLIIASLQIMILIIK